MLLALLDDGASSALPELPELMLRRVEALRLEQGAVVCGCGGGAAVVARLPPPSCNRRSAWCWMRTL